MYVFIPLTLDFLHVLSRVSACRDLHDVFLRLLDVLPYQREARACRYYRAVVPVAARTVLPCTHYVPYPLTDVQPLRGLPCRYYRAIVPAAARTLLP